MKWDTWECHRRQWQGSCSSGGRLGSRQGAKKRDMGDLGRNTWPYSIPSPGLLTTCGIDSVCFHFVTFQPGDRSCKPTTNLGGEDAGRPGQPGGETTPADCRVLRIQARE